MAMSKYRIKETARGFIVLYLKDVGNGYVWQPADRTFTSKEAAQAYIDEMRGTDHEKND